MRPQQEVGAPSHRFADQAHQTYGAFELFLSGLARIVRGEAAGGIEFEAGKPLGHVLGCALGRTIRIVIELVPFTRGGIQIGVGAQALMHLAAEKIVDRLLHGLPDDVPAGHLQAADDAHQREIRAQAETGAIAFAPQRFDLERIAAVEAPYKKIFDHLAQNLRTESGGIHLAQSLDPAGGLQFQKHEIPAAETRRRIAHEKYLDTVELHFLPFLGFNQPFKIRSAAFCATMTVGALVFAEVTVGNTDASTTRKRSMPCTFKRASTTASAMLAPMRHVPTGWYTVDARARKSAIRPAESIAPRSGARASRINTRIACVRAMACSSRPPCAASATSLSVER